ncbi:hypothetical protein [Maricaulis parjimensis]|uniref:hypothetical protein n=1 Tax=Maricaulis parjimensis TaxID=144023 RepID=UPI001939B804|nr:hypothetical protein [Maricaulis parjimensis]
MRLIALTCAAALSAAIAPTVLAQTEEAANTAVDFTTQWTVRAAPGMDAILLIGILSGDELQSHYYGETIGFLREALPSEAVEAADRVGASFRESGSLTGPTLALIFSAGPFATLDDVIASAADPETHLRANLEASDNWSEERYSGLMEILPDVHTALEGLRSINYSAWYQAQLMPNIAPAVEANLAAVSAYDIIPEQERLLGRTLAPEIEILVLRFSQPYGIRITGQRFIAYYGWDANIQLRVAAHEIFHPPFDRTDPEILSRFEALEADPWFRSIVDNHDPAFGYNSAMSILNEDSTQALDQIVSERIGVARDPRQRWTHADGSMHLLAAALYHAMKEDGFDQSGGVYSDWLKSAFDRGLLTPEEVRRRAAIVVDEATVNSWYERLHAEN